MGSSVRESIAGNSGGRGGISKKIRDFVFLILLSTIWGLAFVAIRRADFELSPVNLALLRWIIASAGFLAITPILGKPKTKFEARKDILRLLVVSLNNVVIYSISLNFAEKTVSAGLAGLLISLGPIFIAILSVLLLKEKVGRKLSYCSSYCDGRGGHTREF